MKTHSVKYNFIMNTILKISSFIFPLITFPYVSRILGVELNGKISFATSLVQYFVMFAQLGIPVYGIRACAKVRDNREELSKTACELLIINTCMTVLSYAALIIAMFTVPKINENRGLMLISSATLVLSCLGMEWFYQAIEQYDYITVKSILFKLLSIGLMFFFVHEPKDYLIYAGISVFGTFGSNVLNFSRIRRYISLKPVRELYFKRHLKPVLVFFLFAVSTTIYTSLDSVMLGFLSTDHQVGLYAASIKVRNILFSLVTSIGTVLLPRASYMVQKKALGEYREIIRNSFQFVTVLAVPLTAFFVLEAENVILLLSGTEYVNAATAMMIITPTIILTGISNITGIQILVPLGHEKYTVISTFGGAVTDLVLNALCIPKYGAAGAAFATLITEFVVLLIQLFYMYKRNLSIYLKVDWKNVIKILAGSIMAGMALLLVRQLIPRGGVFISLALSSIVFFGVYVGFMIVSGEFIFRNYGADVIRKVLLKSGRRN